MDDRWVLSVQILDRLDDLANKLRRDTLRESSFTLQSSVDLAFGSELKDEVERVVVFVVVVQLDNVLVV